MKKNITVIGGGNMGGALIEGFLNSGQYQTSNITVADKSDDVRSRFSDMGVKTLEDNSAAVIGADIVIVAVKPYLVDIIAKDILKHLSADTIIVSIAAGVELDTLEKCFNRKTLIYRAIPNIAASLGESMTFVSTNSTDETAEEIVKGMFSTVGEATIIAEKLLDSAMVSASCGMAYALRYIRAAMEASIEMGLTAPMSRLVVSQTVKGACELLLNGEQHPEAMIDMVTTPAGITIVGLNEMEHHGFSSSVIKGHIAAYNKVKK